MSVLGVFLGGSNSRSSGQPWAVLEANLFCSCLFSPSNNLQLAVLLTLLSSTLEENCSVQDSARPWCCGVADAPTPAVWEAAGRAVLPGLPPPGKRHWARFSLWNSSWIFLVSLSQQHAEPAADSKEVSMELHTVREQKKFEASLKVWTGVS